MEIHIKKSHWTALKMLAAGTVMASGLMAANAFASPDVSQVHSTTQQKAPIKQFAVMKGHVVQSEGDINSVKVKMNHGSSVFYIPAVSGDQTIYGKVPLLKFMKQHDATLLNKNIYFTSADAKDSSLASIQSIKTDPKTGDVTLTLAPAVIKTHHPIYVVAIVGNATVSNSKNREK